MDVFEVFAQTVAGCVRGATGAERRAIAQELREHLEDHAAYLAETGLSEDEAAELAVASMGDPEEIGRELDRKYPRVWKPLLYIFIVFLVIWLPIFLFFFSSFAYGYLINTAAAAKIAWTAGSYVSDDPNMIPVDETMTVGNLTLRYYGVSYDRWDDGRPVVILYEFAYRTNVFLPDRSAVGAFVVCDDQGNELIANAGPVMHEPYLHETALFFITEETESLTITYDHYGYSDSVTIPIDYPGGEAP